MEEDMDLAAMEASALIAAIAAIEVSRNPFA
jgi:hypothetical protein